MKFDLKKLSNNELIQSFVLSVIFLGICMLITECPPKRQKICSVIIILGTLFNFLPRKDDSKFS